jgi:hypothetical protein
MFLHLKNFEQNFALQGAKKSIKGVITYLLANLMLSHLIPVFLHLINKLV